MSGHDSAGASDNTQAALHFANAAKRVTMQPRVNEIVRDKALLRHLQMEIKALRTQLVRALPMVIPLLPQACLWLPQLITVAHFYLMVL